MAGCAGADFRTFSEHEMAEKTWPCPRSVIKQVEYFIERCQESGIKRVNCRDFAGNVYCKNSSVVILD